MKNNKSFDCVEMKHQAAEKVQARLEGMSREEKVQYFRERTRVLRDLQKELIRTKQGKKSA